MNSLETVLTTLKQGDFIIVHDEHREKEADFFILAEHVTPEKINFLMTYGKGMICLASDKALLDKMGLGLMADKNEDPHDTSYCMTFDAKEGITTGISAPDRARAIQVFIDPKTSKKDITTPGHSFPLLARDPQLRFGHTDSGVLLAKKAEAIPAMVICEILNEKGEVATLDEIKVLAQKFNVSWTTLDSLRTELLS